MWKIVKREIVCRLEIGVTVCTTGQGKIVSGGSRMEGASLRESTHHDGDASD